MYQTRPSENINMVKAPKKGSCPLCDSPYTRGTRVYQDKRKEESKRYVHPHCYWHMMYERTKDVDPAPF